MTRVGYHLSSEEHAAPALAAQARTAERSGFDFLTISDHFHPWLDSQGHSPFVWGVLGAVAEATSSIEVGTAVTCPTIRMHPAIVAHAAATAATMLPGRFFLGVGTGEALNEHVLGDPWPALSVRLEMLEEAVEVMRLLWRGELTTHAGAHFRVDNARLYDVPDAGVPVHVAASGERSGELAGRIGDGIVCTAPDREAVRAFEQAGGQGRPRTGLLHVCVADDRDDALSTARRFFANTALPGALNTELSLPQHYDAAVQLVDDARLAAQMPLGRDPEEHAAAIRAYADAGFDRVSVHQIGPDQESFARFYADKVFSLVR